jgi:hypothetical protein
MNKYIAIAALIVASIIIASAATALKLVAAESPNSKMQQFRLVDQV